MTKTHTIETIEEYDSNGKLTRKTTTETNEETDQSNPIYDNFWWSTQLHNGPSDRATTGRTYESYNPHHFTTCP